MTVTNTPPIELYVFDGPGAYDFKFLVYDTADIVVFHIDTAGVITTMDVGEYDVTTLQPLNGGTVTVTADTYSAGQLQIIRSVPYEQIIDWVNNDSFNMNLLERSQDELVMMIQQILAVSEDAASTVYWRGDWVGPDVSYRPRDLVAAPDTNWYSCLVEHVSTSDFNADLAAGYWVLFLDLSSVTEDADRADAAADAADQSAAEAAQSALDAASSASEADTYRQAASDSEANAGIASLQAADCAAKAFENAEAIGYSILGTVSEVAGVPSGDIFENRNGIDDPVYKINIDKLASGTMIQSFDFDVGLVLMNIYSGGIYAGLSQVTLPDDFIDEYYQVMVQAITSSGAGWTGDAKPINNSVFSFNYFGLDQNVTDLVVRVIAIGRWFREAA